MKKARKSKNRNHVCTKEFIKLLPCFFCPTAVDDGKTDLLCNFCDRPMCHLHFFVCERCPAIVCKNCIKSVICECCKLADMDSKRTHWIDSARTIYQNKVIHPKDLPNVFELISDAEGTKRQEVNEIRNMCVTETIMHSIERVDVGFFVDIPLCTMNFCEFIGKHFGVILNQMWKDNASLRALLRSIVARGKNLFFALVHCDRKKEVLSWFRDMYQTKETVLAYLLHDASLAYDKSLMVAMKEIGLLESNLLKYEAFEAQSLPHMCNNVLALDYMLSNGVELEALNEDYETSLSFNLKCPDAKDLVKFLLGRGASLENAIHLKSFVDEENFQCLLEHFRATFIRTMPIEMFLPQSDYLSNYSMISKLIELNYCISQSYIKCMINKANECSVNDMRNYLKGRTSSRESRHGEKELLCLVVLFTLNLVPMENTKLIFKTISRAFDNFSFNKVNVRTLPFLSKKLKTKIVTFLLCLNRIKKELKKDLGRDVKMILIDYCFSSLETRAKVNANQILLQII